MVGRCFSIRPPYNYRDRFRETSFENTNTKAAPDPTGTQQTIKERESIMRNILLASCLTLAPLAGCASAGSSSNAGSDHRASSMRDFDIPDVEITDAIVKGRQLVVRFQLDRAPRTAFANVMTDDADQRVLSTVEASRLGSNNYEVAIPLEGVDTTKVVFLVGANGKASGLPNMAQLKITEGRVLRLIYNEGGHTAYEPVSYVEDGSNPFTEAKERAQRENDPHYLSTRLGLMPEDQKLPAKDEVYFRRLADGRVKVTQNWGPERTYHLFIYAENAEGKLVYLRTDQNDNVRIEETHRRLVVFSLRNPWMGYDREAAYKEGRLSRDVFEIYRDS
ncbi:MAG: hypothetical protein HY461_00450 [Parcubacteria group bacterium]|nr:hypothetical protein [Parcubacteria group bacterium]